MSAAVIANPRRMNLAREDTDSDIDRFCFKMSPLFDWIGVTEPARTGR